MSKNKEKKALSLEETLELLDARTVDAVQPPRPDPLGLKVFASQVAQRFSSHGGRPTDPSWELSRKVPMKLKTWKILQKRSSQLRERGVIAAAGQIAAIALERGLEELEDERFAQVSSMNRRCVRARRPIPDETRREARALSTAIEEAGLW